MPAKQKQLDFSFRQLLIFAAQVFVSSTIVINSEFCKRSQIQLFFVRRDE